jgi:hypothetical protein
MHRSLIALSVFVMCAALGWAQDNPATPRPGSGLPQTPITGTQSSPAQPTGQPSNGPASTTAQPSSGQPASAPVTPAASGQPATDKGQAAADKKDTGASQPATGQQGAVAPPAEPVQPKTEIFDSSATSGALATDGHDPILDPAPVPQTTTTLVGGTISSIDRMRNHMTVAVFGGGRWSVNFDERTHIFRNGAETTQLALKKGERVYVDTQLDNNRHDIFARNIRVGVAQLPADADGQIVNVDQKHSELTLRDSINSVPVRFAVDQDTRISNGQSPAAFKDVKPGTLVHVRFAAESPNRGLAREISILATPGSAFTFIGKITYLDLHRGLMAVQNSGDGKNYELRFAPLKTEERNRLGVGTEVRVVATFDGAHYTAQSIDVTKGSGEN